MQTLSSGFSLKALLVGAGLCFALGYVDVYGYLVVHVPSMTFDMSAPGAVFLFFLLVGVANLLLKVVSRRLALNRTELIVVYIMLLIASAVPNRGAMNLPPVLAAPFYYATPENEWDTLIQPHVRPWMAPQEATAVEALYEGLPRGASVPWGVWAEPLLLWFTFFMVLYVVMIALMVILRRQWMDHERLIYPIVQLPLEMVREEQGRNLNPFFRQRLVWIGFLIPFLLLGINSIHDHFQVIPAINLRQRHFIFSQREELFIHVVFAMIGFTYFVNLDIAFSLWFFNLLFKSVKMILNQVGFFSTERLGPYSPGRSPIFCHQDMGAMIVLVLFQLYVGRRHLAGVFRKALGRAPDVDDSGEILSYRSAVLCVVAGLIFMSLWLNLSGVPLWVIPPFLFGAFVLFVALTRIVSESGIAEVAGPITTPAFVASGFGTQALGPEALTALGFNFVWTGEVRTSVMGFCANGLKLGEAIPGRRRPLFWAMLLAAAACFAGTLWALFTYAYADGGLNLGQFPFIVGAKAPFLEYAEPHSRNLVGPRWDGWLYTAIGGVGMALLMFIRQRFLWWPLHPLGFAISSVWSIHFVWFSVFLTWLVKGLILKYGGPKLFRQMRPFFLGLILGEFTAQGVWAILNAFLGEPLTTTAFWVF